MPKAPKNWRKVGYLIPDEIDPEENICVCVPVPKDWGHIRAFLGQMTELSKWLTWEKDGTDSAKRAAARWFEITECVAEEIDCIMTNGCGCGGSQVTNSRINPDTGVYEVSTDGGITWTPDPANDPRASGVVFPGLPGSDGDTKRCSAANSAVGFFEDMQQQEYDSLVANKTLAEIFALLVGILTTLGIVTFGVAAAVGAIIAFVVGLFARMIPEDFNSQFTNDTWSNLLCILYCEMADDGSFTQAQWQTVKSRVASEISGYAGNWLTEHINLLGEVGLTNAARSNYPGARECDDCACTDCQFTITFDGVNWQEYTVDYGTVASEHLWVVAHTFPLGEGHGCYLLIDLMQDCEINAISCDFAGVNQRPGNTLDLSATFYDDEMTLLGSQGFSSSFVADGSEHHGYSPVSGYVARYVGVFYGWIDVGSPNSGWIDNIKINFVE